MSVRSRAQRLSLIAGACTSALVGQPAFAQTAQSDSAEVAEVVVTAPAYVPAGARTATKTDAPLIETPQSVSVVTRDQIDLLNFIDVQQAVRYTAGIVGENYGPDLRFDFLTLRGFIPVQYIDGLQAPVSATISNVGIDLYGFQSVEILKGPSAVLYGSTPPGGLYNLTSRRPSRAFGGELQAKLGEDAFKQAAGTVTGALGNRVSARLTGLYRDRESQTDFVEAERAYLAPAVAFELGPRTTLTALGYYQDDRVDGDTNGFLPVLGVLTANPLGEVRRGVNLGEPDYNTYERQQFSVGYELVHRFGERLTFTQNARYGEYAEDMRTVYATSLGADNRTVGRSNFPFRDDVEQVAVDSRLEALATTGAVQHRLLAGIDYREYSEASAFGFAAASPIDLFDPVYGQAPIVTPAFFPFTDHRLRQTGVYAQDQARIGDVILTASGRQDWVELKNFALEGEPETEQDHFSYRLGATYVSPSGLAPYVSYSTSFQPQVGQDGAGAAFEPTVGEQVEVGVKYDARALPGDVQLLASAAVYRLEQSNVLTPDPVNPVFSVQTGEARASGLELELVTRVRDTISVNASYTYADAEITRSNVAGQVGARLFGQPEHKASLLGDYTVRRGRAAGLGFGAGARYVSDSPGALPGPFTPVVYDTGEATLLDGVARYQAGDYRFSINGSNLADKRYAGRCTGPVGCFFAQGRQVIATVTRTF